MREIILKRNKLRDNAMKFRQAKFDENINPKNTFKLNEQQNEVWKKYKFYEEMVKAYNKKIVENNK